ncbi:MAG: hypothetical protein AAFR61_31680, partial [Bacteroidota bacterium]
MKHLVYFLLLSLPFGLSAQEVDQFTDFAPSPLRTFSTYLTYDQPGTSLLDNGFQRGGGLGMKWFARAAQPENMLNFRLGVTADFLYNGGYSNSYELPLSGETVAIDFGNFQLGTYGTLRLATSELFPVQLYVDAMLGSRLFLSHWGEHLITEYDECETLASDAIGSWHLSYGMDFGAMIRLKEGVRLEMGATFLRHQGVARFHDLESVVYSEEIFDYQINQAA